MLQVQKPGICGWRLTGCQVAATYTSASCAARSWRTSGTTTTCTSPADSSVLCAAPRTRAATIYARILNSNIPSQGKSTWTITWPALWRCPLPWTIPWTIPRTAWTPCPKAGLEAPPNCSCNNYSSSQWDCRNSRPSSCWSIFSHRLLWLVTAIVDCTTGPPPLPLRAWHCSSPSTTRDQAATVAVEVTPPTEHHRKHPLWQYFFLLFFCF